MKPNKGIVVFLGHEQGRFPSGFSAWMRYSPLFFIADPFVISKKHEVRLAISRNPLNLAISGQEFTHLEGRTAKK